MLDVFIPFANAIATVGLLDQIQREVEDKDGTPVTLIKNELMPSGPFGSQY